MVTIASQLPHRPSMPSAASRHYPRLADRGMASRYFCVAGAFDLTMLVAQSDTKTYASSFLRSTVADAKGLPSNLFDLAGP